ncbi:MAG: hypothetical protein LBC73_07710 [Oscillospiraceae bacterium]|jgi:DNA-directed RNA polymerase subunit RPC12/RpoP|nr:hypothetical protein [Oscillospiraceae bacterium]
MAIINEIKCARCDRKYSGVRSRCPYCGARRIGRGKYSEDSDNAKGKMLISIMILGVFTLAAGILLFTTPVDAAPPTDDPALSMPDLDEITSLTPFETPTPTPPPETPPPPQVQSLQIWVPNSHRIGDDFALTTTYPTTDLTVRIEPPGLDVEPVWELSNDETVEMTQVVGGYRFTRISNGSVTLTVSVGDVSVSCVIYVMGMG